MKNVKKSLLSGIAIWRRKKNTTDMKNESSNMYTAKNQYRTFELTIPRIGIAPPQSQFPHSCVCERFIHIFQRSICLFCCRKYVDWSWEDINRSETHECENWDWGRANSQKRNTEMGFSLPCSIEIRYWKKFQTHNYWVEWLIFSICEWTVCSTE